MCKGVSSVNEKAKSDILIDKPRLQYTIKQGMQLINDPKEGNGGEASITREDCWIQSTVGECEKQTGKH